MAETFAVRDAILRGSRLATSEPVDRASPEGSANALTLPFVGRDTAFRTAIEVWQGRRRPRERALRRRPGRHRKKPLRGRARATIETEGGLVVRGETAAGGEYRPYEAFVDALRAAARIRALRVQKTFGEPCSRSCSTNTRRQRSSTTGRRASGSSTPCAADWPISRRLDRSP